jgi:hypothetical protein
MLKRFSSGRSTPPTARSTRRVYQLYGLSAAEIALVEAASS